MKKKVRKKNARLIEANSLKCAAHIWELMKERRHNIFEIESRDGYVYLMTRKDEGPWTSNFLLDWRTDSCDKNQIISFLMRYKEKGK